MQMATPTAGWHVLNDWTVMAVTGPQAQAFLQGQVTCDIRTLTPGESRIGAHCDPKGRMQMSFRALADTEERVLLRVPRSMTDATRESLGKYIVFSKAELTQENYRIRGLYGPEAREQISELFVDPAREAGQWVRDQAGSIILTLGSDRFECWLSEEQASTLDQTLGAPQPGDNLWRQLDIQAGIGEVLPPTRGQLTPQSLNFTQIGAVSFKKGCYTGQEIVARLHYKGKLKQHMRRLAVDTGDLEALPPGTPVQTDEGKKVGELVMAASISADQSECLALMDDRALDQPLRVGNTFPAKPLSLPYTLE